MEEQNLKRNRHENDSSNTSETVKRKKNKSDSPSLPLSVSYWTRSHAEKLGIFYNSKATNIADFFKLSQKSDVFVYPLKKASRELLNTLVDVTKEKMHHTVKLQMSVKATSLQLLYSLEEIQSCQEILSALHKFAKNEELDPERALYVRRSHYKLEEFFLQLQSIYIKGSKSIRIAECEFTELLAAFTRIFLLNVETVVRKRTLKIGSALVSSVPDLSIWTPYPFANNLQLFVGAVAELTPKKVKLEKMGQIEEDDPFEISMAVGDRILGQHAGELLFEVSSSAFKDVAMGFICMQTTIIFTYLEISKEHHFLIEEHGYIESQMEMEESGSRSGIIYYTRPYNYLEEKDRNEIIEFLFWLGLHSLPFDYTPKETDT